MATDPTYDPSQYLASWDGDSRTWKYYNEWNSLNLRLLSPFEPSHPIVFVAFSSDVSFFSFFSLNLKDYACTYIIFFVLALRLTMLDCVTHSDLKRIITSPTTAQSRPWIIAPSACFWHEGLWVTNDSKTCTKEEKERCVTDVYTLTQTLYEKLMLYLPFECIYVTRTAGSQKMTFSSLNYRTKKPQLHVNNTTGMKGEENSRFLNQRSLFKQFFIFDEKNPKYLGLCVNSANIISQVLSFFVSVTDAFICTLPQVITPDACRCHVGTVGLGAVQLWSAHQRHVLVPALNSIIILNDAAQWIYRCWTGINTYHADLRVRHCQHRLQSAVWFWHLNTEL